MNAIIKLTVSYYIDKKHIIERYTIKKITPTSSIIIKDNDNTTQTVINKSVEQQLNDIINSRNNNKKIITINKITYETV